MSLSERRVKAAARDDDANSLTGVLVLLAAGVAVGAWTAFVLSKLYAWFLVSLGLPPLSWWHVWGLMLIFGMLTVASSNSETDNRFSRLLALAITKMAYGALVLLVGWMVSWQVAS